jgi:hypothetical protein
VQREPFKGFEVPINLVDDKPVYVPPYPIPPHLEQDAIVRILKDVEDGYSFVTQEPQSYNAPFTVVPKPESKDKVRICGNYKELNKKTKNMEMVFPTKEDLITFLAKFKGERLYMSKIDFNHGFLNFLIKKEDWHKTATYLKGVGYIIHMRMRQGWKLGPYWMQRGVYHALGEFLGKFLFNYQDDLLVVTSSLEDHISAIDQVLNKCLEHRLQINWDKSDFVMPYTKYLGLA